MLFPICFYSGTKALAEEGLRWFGDGYIWRPATVFDEFDHPRNYLSEVQQSFKILDRVNSFSHRGDFVRACVDIWERRVPFGTYNIVNPGAATTKQITAQIQRILGNKRSFEFWETEAEFTNAGGKASRNSCILDASKLLSAGIAMRPLREAMEDSLKKWQPTPQNEQWPVSNGQRVTT